MTKKIATNQNNWKGDCDSGKVIYVHLKQRENVEEILEFFVLGIPKLQRNYTFVTVSSIKSTLKHFFIKDFLVVLITAMRRQKTLLVLKTDEKDKRKQT